ncbi:Uncharacterised protein [Vibrio cholerae]|nr:Uncharacterised protein [Vibrio cholerae]CSI83180.1 Uncharacterised protein [Vibrio cholerae]
MCRLAAEGEHHKRQQRRWQSNADILFKFVTHMAAL